MVMFQKRTNLRPNIVGRIFGVHRTTVKRQAQAVDTALENVLPTAPAMAERLRMIKDTEEFVKFTGGAFMQDGTLTPALDFRDADNPETSGFSGKHHQAGFSSLVMAAKTEVIFDVTKPAPVNQHDITICRNNPVDFGLWSTASIPRGKNSCQNQTHFTAVNAQHPGLLLHHALLTAEARVTGSHQFDPADPAKPCAEFPHTVRRPV